MFLWPDSSKRWSILREVLQADYFLEVENWSVECGRWPRVAMCWSQLAPMNLLQGTAEPISKAGGVCVKKHLRKTAKGKRVRNSPVNAKARVTRGEARTKTCSPK